mgnify:CR=1 FL=1
MREYFIGCQNGENGNLSGDWISGMEDNKQGHKNIAVTVWHFIILFLCIYVLVELFVETVFTLRPEILDLLHAVDSAVCFIFIADFLVEVIFRKDRLAYLKWGWIDLVSSFPFYLFSGFPFLPQLRWGRIIRALRVIRAIRSTSHLVRYIVENRAQGTFLSAAMVSFLLVVFAAVAILNIETLPESNIKTGNDAFWWAFSTVTTVGYGDKYPVTVLGRVIAALLMTVGVALFSISTAYIASLFIEPDQKAEKTREQEILREVKMLNEKIDHLEKKLSKDSGDSSRSPKV